MLTALPGRLDPAVETFHTKADLKVYVRGKEIVRKEQISHQTRLFINI